MAGCVCLAGFLKFLKRGKRESLDELDLPPAPPPLNGSQMGFEELGFDEKLPELPEFPEFDEKASAEMPKFEFPEENMPAMGGENAMPELPSFPEETPMQTAAYPSIPEPSPQITQPMPEPEKAPEEEHHEFVPESYPKMAGRLFSQEKRILRERPNVKTIYVKVDNFKATLGSISMARSDLRKSEEGLVKLESIKNAKDRSVDKLKSSLDDLQKKLIFIDKTLFKGE